MPRDRKRGRRGGSFSGFLGKGVAEPVKLHRDDDSLCDGWGSYREAPRRERGNGTGPVAVTPAARMVLIHSGPPESW